MKADNYYTFIESLETALRIGKYVTSHKDTYKKDKKRVKKLLNDAKKGDISQYLKSEIYLDE